MEEEEDVPCWLWEDVDEDSYFMPINKLKFTEERIVRRVYSLGRIISALFSEENIHYWTSGGSTLGIVRHGGLIPWDDDLDICVKEQEEGQLKGLTKRLEEVGCCLQPAQSYSWKIFHRTESDEIPGGNFQHRFPFCDVFVMREKKGLWELRDKEGRNTWPDEKYTTAQVSGRVKRQFGDFSLFCPAEPEEYLDRTYGPSWPHTGKTHFFNHGTGGLTIPTTFELATHQPAQPFN